MDYLSELNNQQLDAVQSTEGNLRVIAGAGSGKTKPPVEKTDNRQLFYNIELLDEAISKGGKVCFYYTEYHSDKKPHKRRRADGTVRNYVINPYHIRRG